MREDCREKLRELMRMAAKNPGLSVPIPPDIQVAIDAEIHTQEFKSEIDGIRRRERHTVYDVLS